MNEYDLYKNMRDSEADAFDQEFERVAASMGFGGSMGRLGYAGPMMGNPDYMRSRTDVPRQPVLGYADDDNHGFYMDPRARRPDMPVNKRGPVDIAPTQPNFRSGNNNNNARPIALPAPPAPARGGGGVVRNGNNNRVAARANNRGLVNPGV